MKAIIMHSGLASLSSNTLLKRYIERKLLVFCQTLWTLYFYDDVLTIIVYEPSVKQLRKNFFYDYTFTFCEHCIFVARTEQRCIPSFHL